MSKNSNSQRHAQLKIWDEWMQNKYPNYRERKLKYKNKPTPPPYYNVTNDDF